MRKKINVIQGEKYGKLTVIKEISPRILPSGSKERRVLCSCDCDGKEVEVSLSNLRNGSTTSCGCIKEGRIVKVQKGDKYGKLTIIEEVEPYIDPDGTKRRVVLCQCDCGSDPIKVRLNSLRRGSTTSCGCYVRDNMRKRKKRFNKYISNEDGSITGYTLKGEPFLFDECCYDKIKEYCWRRDKFGYITTTDNNSNKEIRMHRLITNCPDNKVVDHKDHNVANNQLSNLRVCEISDNNKNIKVRKDSTSGVTGVSWVEKFSKWRARINIDGKRVSLGYFTNKEDAIAARHKAELEHYGTFSPNYEKLTQNESSQPSEQQNT